MRPDPAVVAHAVMARDGGAGHAEACGLCHVAPGGGDGLCAACRAIHACAVRLARGQPVISLSLVQRTLKLGYATARRLLARLECDGEVHAADGEGLRRSKRHSPP